MTYRRKNENINDFRKRAREDAKKRYEKDPEQVKKQNKEWREEHLEHVRKYAREYYERHKKTTRYRTNHNKACRVYQKRFHDSLIKLLGGICVICKTIEQLQIDHINGGGEAERLIKFKRNIGNFHRYYLEHPDEAKEKLQVLCKTHNKEKKKKLKENGKAYSQKWRDHYTTSSP